MDHPLHSVLQTCGKGSILGYRPEQSPGELATSQGFDTLFVKYDWQDGEDEWEFYSRVWFVGFQERFRKHP